MKELICPFCSKESKSPHSHRAHICKCPSDPAYKAKPKTEKWLMTMRDRKPMNQYTKAEELGLPKPELSDETRRKLGKGGKRIVWDEAKRARHSAAMKKAVKENADSYSANNVSGRVKLYEYNGAKLKGRWELDVAKYFTVNGIEWTNDIKPFPYKWENGWHLYFPDFYLPEKDVYIEVKGYERERDHAKWSVVSNLVVLRKKEIMAIRKGEIINI